jgi:hypothetical protein
MTASQSLKIYNVLLRHFKSEEDANIVVQEIEQIVASKFDSRTTDFSTKSETALLNKDMENIRVELLGKIESSSLRLENSIKTEIIGVKNDINKLIIWIIGTMLASGALFITLAKVFFDK